MFMWAEQGGRGLLHSVPSLALLSLALYVAGALVLVYSALHDIAVRTIPNSAALLLLVIGIALRGLDHLYAPAALAGGLVFGVMFLFWRLGWMGGGDVKLLTAAAVFLPPAAVPGFVIATSLAGGLLAVLYLAGSLVAPKPASVRPGNMLRRVLRTEIWRLRRRGPLPYATAIAAGGLYATILQLHH
jgi:prepilin peptidase CpaA